MKTKTKIFAILLTIAMVLSVLMPTLSNAAATLKEDGGTNTVTITGALGGKTIKGYKLFDLEISGASNENYEYSFNVASKSAEFFKNGFKDPENPDETLKFDNIIDVTEYLRKIKDNETALIKIAEQYYTFAKNNNVSPVVDTEKLAVDASKVEFKVTNGYFLFYDATSAEDISEGQVTRSASMLASTVIDDAVEIKLKSNTISKPEKTVDQTTANIGDTVTYTVKAQVPGMTGYTKFEYKFVDTFSKGLTIDTDSVNVKIVDGDEKISILPKSVTTKANSDSDDNTKTDMTIDLGDIIKYKDKEGKDIVVTYTAIINEHALEKDSTGNVVKVVYENDPQNGGEGESTPDDVDVKVYSLQFTKKNFQNEALKGMTFELYRENDKENPLTFNANNVYDKEGTKTEFTSGDDGVFEFKGLAAGNYILREKSVPDGSDYTKPSFDFKIEIKGIDEKNAIAEVKYNNDAATEKGYVKDLGTASEVTDEHGYLLTATVLNARKGELPSTGGTGTVIFTVVGVAVMVVAATVLVVRNKNGKED